MDRLSSRKSAVSGKEVQVGTPHYCRGARFISLDEVDFGRRFEPLNINEVKDVDSIVEALELGKKLKLSEGEIGDLGSIRGTLGRIGYFRTELRLEENVNLVEAPFAYKSVNCYFGPVYSESENCGFCSWPRTSKNVFGSHMAFSSNSCIKAYNSVNLARCFEVDGSANCADLYFSHNCENVNDSMFCFNVKNLRRGIGNAEYPQDEYKRIRAGILGQVAGEIESTKGLRWNVFNIGCGKGE